MSVKVKYSNSYQAKIKRIKRLPTLMEKAISGATKRDLIEINKIFQKGIRDNKFNLDKLSEYTIKQKRSKGLPKPRTPLYGKGDTDDRSYINMLEIYKVKNGWVLRPSSKYHHEKKIKLKDLFVIHEYGAKIRKENGTLIQIPPRPALLMAYRRYMYKKRAMQEETAKEVKKAMTEYINYANKKKLKNLEDFEKREK